MILMYDAYPYDVIQVIQLCCSVSYGCVAVCHTAVLQCVIRLCCSVSYGCVAVCHHRAVLHCVRCMSVCRHTSHTTVLQCVNVCCSDTAHTRFLKHTNTCVLYIYVCSLYLYVQSRDRQAVMARPSTLRHTTASTRGVWTLAMFGPIGLGVLQCVAVCCSVLQ